MPEHDLTTKLCTLAKDYWNATGLSCSYRLLDGGDRCTDCGECRRDLFCLLCTTAPEYAQACEKQTAYSCQIAFGLGQP